MPSRRHNEAMLSSPLRPSITIRIFSSAENRHRVFRRMSRTAFSADSLARFAARIVPSNLSESCQVPRPLRAGPAPGRRPAPLNAAYLRREQHRARPGGAIVASDISATMLSVRARATGPGSTSSLVGDPLGPIEVGLVYPTTISSRAQVANPRGPGAT